ncbi:MAG TPA: hypothetical protein VGK54_07615 [Chloroflexota bacterium]|jgi:predicted transcriptional regulator
MVAKQLVVRLDEDRQHKLSELATRRNAPVSEVIFQIIDDAYDQALLREDARQRAKRRQAAQGLLYEA